MYKDIDEAIEKRRQLERSTRAKIGVLNDETFIRLQTELAEHYLQEAEWLEELKAIKENAVFYSNRPIEDIVLEAKAEAEKEYLLNTYGLTIKIAEAEKQKIRTNTIDEFVNLCKTTETHLITNWEKPFGIDFDGIEEIAEQLKEQKNE